MRYVPLLPNGQPVPLSWPLAIFRRLNHIFWPLKPDAGWWTQRLDYLLAIIGCLIFTQHNDAELRYLITERNNVDLMLTGMPTYLILVECHLRGLRTVLHRVELRRLLQHFYARIYVEREKEPVLFDQIEQQMRPSRFMAAMYLIALLSYTTVPILSVVNHRKDYLYPMIFPFDATPLYFYVPLLLSNIWVAIMVDSMIFGEGNAMGEMLTHLNTRYLLLRRDLDLAASEILAAKQRPHMARQLRLELTQLLRRNVALNNFAEQLEKQYNVSVFIMLSFSAALLCSLFFKVYTNPAVNYTYAFWFIAKTVELLAIGQLGTNLAYTTDSLSSMYYESHWEQVIYHSSNVAENVRLMKLVTLAIEVNAKPFYLTGLKYFRVSQVAVLKILQGAFSYFTFLTSMR